MYRAGRTLAKDRQATLKAVNDGIEAYLSVLKNSTRQEDASYNYEFLVRLRDDILESRSPLRLPGRTTDPNGMPGLPLERVDTNKFKIYIPLSPEERDKAGGTGKVGPIKRKG